MGDTERVRSAAKVLVAISIGAFLATFNETFLNVALTPIMHDFGVTSGDVQWVSTAYMLVAAVTVLVTSFLYRSVPTRRLSLIALALLLAGTLLGAASSSFPMLIVARCIQALGTGMIVPIGMNLTLLVAPQGKLGTYMGVVSAVTLVGPAFGPIAGGLMLSVADWHALFIVFAVLVVVAIAVNALFVGNFEKLTHPKLDVPSVALICVGLIGVMYAISTAFSGSATVAAVSFVVGAACLAAFVIRQRAIDNPLLDMRPFGDKGFVCGVLVVFIAFMAVFAMNILLPLFMQNYLGFSALDAALTLLVPCMSCVVFAPVAGKLFDRYGFKFTLPAALLMMAVFLFTMSCIGGSATALLLAAVYLTILAGCNFSIGPSQSFALDRLTDELHPPWRHRVLHGHSGGWLHRVVVLRRHHERRAAAGDRFRRNRATGCRDGLFGELHGGVGAGAGRSVLRPCHGAFRGAKARRRRPERRWRDCRSDVRRCVCRRCLGERL